MAEKVDGCCLSAFEEHLHKEVVIPSELHVHIGLSMSGFQLGCKVCPLSHFKKVNHTVIKSFCTVNCVGERLSHVAAKT